MPSVPASCPCCCEVLCTLVCASSFVRMSWCAAVDVHAVLELCALCRAVWVWRASPRCALYPALRLTSRSCPPPGALTRQALAFFKTLFEKWNAQSVTHSVSVVFTCRSVWGRVGWSRRFSAAGLEAGRSPMMGPYGTMPPPHGVKRMPDGRWYEDFYEVGVAGAGVKEGQRGGGGGGGGE